MGEVSLEARVGHLVLDIFLFCLCVGNLLFDKFLFMPRFVCKDVRILILDIFIFSWHLLGRAQRDAWQ